ncbi:purine-nucleoside phosphorylase [Melioribacteraceae bacterium 4301-Me]|uniref:purine-nucleoside phosphorylase n=1 Tax=Pyranulibacter aquaticus TaxID=3163344 RepID=UPI003597567A
MVDLNEKYEQLIQALQKHIPFAPELCIILGSGLGDFINKIKLVNSISSKELPNYPQSTIEGHKGYIHFAKHAQKKLLLFQGRIHFYEGYTLSDVFLPVHIASKLGCYYLLLTNAAGGINKNLVPGDLMLNVSFNAINIKKELANTIGVITIKEKNRFLDFPSEEFNSVIKQAAIEEKINLKEGNYWYTKGPSYETPAEIKMISLFHGDAVGMSTAHEAIYGAKLGMKVASVSCITNYAAGLSNKKLNHQEVIDTADKVKNKFEKLVKKTIELL